MKTVIVLAALVALCYAAPLEVEGTYELNPQYVPIVRQDQDINPDGSYSWGFESGDGTAVQAKGVLKNAGGEDGETLVVEGSYSYLDARGAPVSLSYVADEFGFHPKSDLLP